MSAKHNDGFDPRRNVVVKKDAQAPDWDADTNDNIPTEELAPLLEVKDLSVDFTGEKGRAIHAVDKASFTVYPGQWVAIVGESGSGKSTSAMSVLGLLPGTGHVTGGSIKFNEQELVGMGEKDYERLRGRYIGLVPQDPMSNLNPVWRIGTQIEESLKANHMDVAREKRNALSKSLQEADVKVRRTDDELFIGSQDIDDLVRTTQEALASSHIENAQGKMRKLRHEWVVGSETRWAVAQSLIREGLDEETAWKIAKNHVTGSSMKDRVAGLLDEAGLPDAATRARQYPGEFSGGMRQRALIAMGLASRPDLLIADEPTSALDVTVQKKILDHLQEMTDTLGTAVLFITHDLGLAAERAQYIVVMYRGHVVESGPSLEVLQHPQHPYTQRLVKAAPSLASQRMISAYEEGAADADAGLAHKQKAAEAIANGEAVIEVQHLVKKFKLPHQKEMFRAVDDVSFSVKKGMTLAIVGESGSGKSTVANMVLHLLKQDGGKILYNGVDTSTFNSKDLLNFRRHVQPVFQNPYGSLDPMYSIYRSIEEPDRYQGIAFEEGEGTARHG